MIWWPLIVITVATLASSHNRSKARKIAERADSKYRRKTAQLRTARTRASRARTTLSGSQARARTVSRRLRSV